MIDKYFNKQTTVQFIKFGVVGATNTVISYLLNISTLFLLQGFDWTWDYIMANMVAFFLSVLWSFYWNHRFVFREKTGERRNLKKALIKTYISYSFSCIFLANILSWMWIFQLGISKYIAPLLNLIVTVPINFLLNKLWAFSED